ncbi:glycosyltransferase [Agromyces sp. SYSU T00194]|uniref:glycosyltransferase n=1 Tax=Agromyces chitinivorans TaxID=3158560 RepID=UPI003397EFC9
MSGPHAGRPLRVLHLDHTTARGGAEYALLRMLRADPAWSPVVLLAPTDAPDHGVYRDLPAHVPVRVAGVHQPAGVSAGGRLRQVDALLRLGAQAVATRVHRAFRSADVVHANTARAAAYGALAARTSRVPFVVHLRDMTAPDAIGAAGHALMTRLVLPRADGVIANSHATLESARPYLRAGARSAVIPSAAGLRPASGAPRLEGPLRIGMLARIDPWKGQDLLLRAFAAALPDSDARLELPGDAPFGHEAHAARLQALAVELGVADRVEFPGHVEDVPGTLARWDVAVQASVRAEPLGQNVLQYLAAGRAVVVAGEGGPAEWVADGVNGLVVEPRDVPALAEALGRLAADAALRERLATAAAATPGLLDDAAVAAAHARFYAEVRAAVSG